MNELVLSCTGNALFFFPCWKNLSFHSFFFSFSDFFLSYSLLSFTLIIYLYFKILDVDSTIIKRSYLF